MCLYLYYTQSCRKNQFFSNFFNWDLKGTGLSVLIDLKTGKLIHQDIGQMDSYIHIFDELQKGEDDNPTIGII